MSQIQYLEELDYSINAQYDRFDGFDRGDLGENQEYEPTKDELEEMMCFVGPERCACI